ncbi:NAD(P)H nitroreductase [Nocardia mangyaensis]|uniref:NAD(P)H nitroreductase n=1 Tax=Nocardia mangyaensis TaxID=2213200 RepID=A0A1J0W2I1_9NOCA|nr:NAD(P)H nitroreductase [Nocardia mangyaensis]APE38462.1 NAD(P)H nitroreductase [Nocardia mangyaensis]
MKRGLPDDTTVQAALALAGRAPSVHNVQPWRWRIADHSIHLYLDPQRALPVTDPDHRDIVISCGAALHHLAVALAALGRAPVIHRIPDPAEPNHLAALTLVPRRPTALDIELSTSIGRRRTDRRHYTSWPIPSGYLGLFSERAAAHGAVLRRIEDRESVQAAFRAASRVHANDHAYRFELAMWSGRPGSVDGVPARNTVLPNVADEFPTREFAAAGLTDPATQPDYAELLLIGTSADDRVSRLRAGEAISSVLLTATGIGLATCLLTEPLELADQRATIRAELLHDTAHPQAMLRVGWAPTSGEVLPETPRRPLGDLLLIDDEVPR